MNCNNCTNNNALKEVKIKHVHGNVLRMAIPLTLRTIELVDGEINATDTPFVPSSEHPVKVVFSKGSVSVALDATMKDGNIAYIEEKGKIPVGTYAITVTCNDDNGNPYRFKQNAVLYVADATIEAGIEETIEYEVTTWYLDAAIFLALKGEDGVGIDDIETQSSGEIGGVNTVTFILTDGRTRSFNVLNGSGAVDSDLDINSQSPIANSAVTAKFNELAGELADLFGDVDYDTSSKTIRFWDKGKTNVLASLDARPFIKDGMVSNAYISNNTLVITFNTDSGKEAIGVPLTTVFNPNNYYTKTQVDSRIASAVANINLSNYYTKAQTDAKLSQKVNLDATTGRVDASQATRVVLDYIVGIYDGEDEPSHDVNAGDVWYDNGQIHYAYNNDVIVVIKSLGAPQKGIIYCNAESNKLYRWNGSEFVQVGGGNSDGGYEPPVGGIPKSDLAQSVQDTLDDVSNKVDKVAGKGLSTEDYTTSEKQKLAWLSNYDDTAIQVEVDAKYEKPSTGIPKTDLASDVQVSLGKADTALQSQVQSDWNENDTSDPAYIANKPTIPEAQVNSDWNASSGVAQILNKPTIPTVPTNVSAFVNDAGYLTQHQDISGKANSADLAAVATSGDYEDLVNTPDIPTVPTNVSAFTNDAGYLTSHQSLAGYATEGYVSTAIADLVDSAPQTLDTLKELADALGDDPNFATTMATQLGNKVDKETGKGLSTNDYTTAEKNKLASLENYDDSALQTAIDGKVDKETGKSLMTDAERIKLQGIAAGAEVNVQPNWTQTNTSADDYIKNKPTLATVATSGSYNDLQDKPTIPAAYDDTTLSGRVSALENAGFITTETDPNVPSWAKQQTKPTYTAQEVGALPASTTIPTKTSDLTNDSGFIDKAMYYGESTTAAATMPKVCTVETFPTYTNNGVTHAKEGTIIAVKFTNSDTNTTDAPSLNVNGIGAKAIMYNNAIVTSTAKNTTVAGTAKMLAYYRYDPALDEGNGAWEFLAKSVDSNSTYSNASLGQGYGTQSNSSAATAITSSISSYALSSGGIVTIKFTYDVPANATLNINSKGAKAIYNQGAAITAGVIKAGDTATFIYSTYYYLLSVDSWQDKQDTISDLATIRSGAALGASALQSYTETDPTVPSWAKQQTKPTYTAQEVGAIPTVISTTYANLVTTRTNSQLIAGAWYRINNYTCTTTQDDTQSAGHQFDILVQATSPNTLSEEAKAIRHEGDTYFANANLEAWKIWYCLDNDTTRFAWADATNGKGVIYRMIDEWGNDCPYDFKNIQFKRDLTDGGLDTANGTTTWVYTFNLWHTAQELYFDASIIGNTLKNDEGFVNGVYNNKMGIVNSYTPYYGSGSSKTNFVLPNNVFLTKGEDLDYYGCYSNTLGDGCFSNTFGDNCFANTFGDYCSNNTFVGSCYSNTFGDRCSNNTFGNECTSIRFGDNCFANTFGDYCSNNTFVGSCYSNTFGDGCSNNTFGNECYSVTFGNYCNCNTFGNYCYLITFLKSYTQYVIVENGNTRITLTSTQTPTSSNPLRNITIAQGVNNTNTAKTISHNTLNDTFRTTYVATNSVEVQV